MNEQQRQTRRHLAGQELRRATRKSGSLGITPTLIPLIMTAAYRAMGHESFPAEPRIRQVIEDACEDLRLLSLQAGCTDAELKSGRNPPPMIWRVNKAQFIVLMIAVAAGIRWFDEPTWYVAAGLINSFCEPLAGDYPNLVEMIIDSLNPENDIVWHV